MTEVARERSARLMREARDAARQARELIDVSHRLCAEALEVLPPGSRLQFDMGVRTEFEPLTLGEDGEWRLPDGRVQRRGWVVEQWERGNFRLLDD